MRVRGRENTGRVRMADVATRAGVSAVTVSRVLHQPDKVALATRERVEAAILELGYLPNLVARSLAATRSGMVAALIPTVDNALHAEIVQAMQERLRDAGLHLLLGCTEFSIEEEEVLTRTFLARQPEALYLTGITHTLGTRELLTRMRIPVVEVANLTDTPIDMVAGYSSSEAARAMVAFLLARGHRMIGYIFSTIGDNDRMRDRHRAYRTTLEAAGIPVDPALLVETEISYAGGARALVELLGRRPDVEAVFCSTDVLAVGVLLECLRRGIAVPGRLAVAGFDDLPLAAEAVPALTTVRIPRRRMGEVAAALILARLAGEEVEPRVVDVGYELIRRASA